MSHAHEKGFMDAYYGYLNSLVNKSKSNYSAHLGIKWINPYLAHEFREIRNQLLEDVGLSILFQGTKPYFQRISKGCDLCGKGKWSCLFITGRCNAKCFYCPSSQNIDEVPSSQGLTFPTAASYAEYVRHFSFEGVSFSGGEPLLYPARVLDYLQEIRKSCSPDVYVWLYTNGLLGGADIFKDLAEQGLDEIRFDIGATNYRIDKLKLAKGIIPNITVEIPAVPEDLERLKALLPEMIKAGVTNLNLHQLRLTPYNVDKLVRRGYTMIAAEKPIVLESEIAALQIIDYARKRELDIGINYCSFFFKNRFQPAGFRKQMASRLAAKDSSITSKGFIRTCNTDEISYHTIRIADNTRPGHFPNLLELDHKKYNFSSDLIHHQCIEDGLTYEKISALINHEPLVIPEDEVLFKIWMHEYIERNLRIY